jgi:hypothetical protein
VASFLSTARPLLLKAEAFLFPARSLLVKVAMVSLIVRSLLLKAEAFLFPAQLLLLKAGIVGVEVGMVLKS